jgi:DMSO/TMAO reductase YedYZ molybdopterin-dependent catalytic subunit
MNADRLPPGQQLAAPGKWPIVGERESAPAHQNWSLHLSGFVVAPQSWSLDELHTLPQVSRTIDIHCVTRWSRLDMEFRGVPLATLLEITQPTNEAKFVSFIAHSVRQHSTSLPIADVLELDVLIALEAEGRPLDTEHGGPIRAVTPGRYFYKSVKWLTSIELLSADRLGFWEASAGYHNRADPWHEERFVASGITKQEAARILAARDISGRDLLGLDGSDRDLSGLLARGALLRNANFQRAKLTAANFDGANLSNAQFVDANLAEASLQNADLEGANFIGCDLRGADLRGASLFGALLVDAKLDHSTKIDPSALEALTPRQAEYVAKYLTV